MNYPNASGTGSESVARERLTDAWQPPRPLPRGATSDLQGCSGVHSNLLEILYWEEIITLMSQMCLLALTFFSTSSVQDEICNQFPKLYFISSVAWCVKRIKSFVYID